MTTEVVRLRRTARLALVIIALVVLASGCSSARSAEGSSVAAASRLVAGHAGVVTGRVELRNYKSGFTSRWGVDVYFTPARDALRSDDSPLLRDLLRIGWSVEDHPIDGGVSLVLEDSSGVNLAQVARTADVPPFSANESLPGELTVSSSEMEREFGGWPGRKSDLVPDSEE